MSDGYQEHLIAIGEKAFDLMAGELGLERNRNNMYLCPYPDHQDSNPSCQWKPRQAKFWCYGCKRHFDYIDFLKIIRGVTGSDIFTALSEASGIPCRTCQRPTKPQTIPEKSDDQAIAYLKTRGIGPEAIKAYGVTNSATEVFMPCWDYFDEKWQVSCVKRRKVDGTEYENGKEMYVAGGRTTFFGLTQLRDDDMVAWVCEGLLDAMQFYQSISNNEPKLLEKNAILSIPGGSSSFATAWNHCSVIKRAKGIVVLPDADQGGKVFLDAAVSCVDPKILGWVDVSKLTGMAFSENHGSDIGEFLDLYPDAIREILDGVEEPPIESLSTLDGVTASRPQRFLDSGFLTLDQNDSGLKAGRLTILSGARGQGKTTLARQMAMAVVMQNTRVFCYFGESSLSEEKGRFARLCAQEGEILREVNEYGVDKYFPSSSAIDRFKVYFQKLLLFYDVNKLPENSALFPHFLQAMENASIRGCRLFLIDSMMMLLGGAKDTFAQQREIIKALKRFATHHSVHVLLIAHPRKGDGLQSISGALEQENMADTILYYCRGMVDQNDEADLPPDAKPHVTAKVITRKIRDEGTMKTAFLAWDGIRGAVIEMSKHELAMKYEERGYWTKHVSIVKDFEPKKELIGDGE